MNAKDRFRRQGEIITRAQQELSPDLDRVSLMMDLESVTKLDLDGLLTASEFDFAHDICGIIRHMDRSTYPGKLRNCFVPRYARHSKEAA